MSEKNLHVSTTPKKQPCFLCSNGLDSKSGEGFVFATAEINGHKVKTHITCAAGLYSNRFGSLEDFSSVRVLCHDGTWETPTLCQTPRFGRVEPFPPAE